jgi:hypothetical protein
MSRHRPFFALSEPIEGGRGSTATGGPPGTVALARSIVTPSAPCICQCIGSRTPCCATTAEPLVGVGLWSSCVRLLLQHLLWGRAIPIPAGRALGVCDALEPLPCATLGAGMPCGMVHREQVRCRCRGHIRRQREQVTPLGTSGVSVSLAGMRRCLAHESRSTARVRPSKTLAWQSAWDALGACPRKSEYSNRWLPVVT